MEYYMELLTQLKDSHVGDKKSDKQDLVRMIDARTTMILKHYKFDRDAVSHASIFRQSSAERLKAVQERLQNHSTLTSLADGAAGMINRISDQFQDRFDMRPDIKFNLDRGVFEIHLGLTTWGINFSVSDSVTQKAKFQKIKEEFKHDGVKMFPEKHGNHICIEDTPENRKYLEKRFQEIIPARGFEYITRENEIWDMNFVCRPVIVDAIPESEPVVSDTITEDELVELQSIIREVLSDIHMLGLDTNLILSCVEGSISHLEDLLGFHYLVYHNYMADKIPERRINDQIRSIEKAAQEKSMELLLDPENMIMLYQKFNGFCVKHIAPFGVNDFMMDRYGYSTITIAPRRLSYHKEPINTPFQVTFSDRQERFLVQQTNENLRELLKVFQKMPNAEIRNLKCEFMEDGMLCISSCELVISNALDFKALEDIEPKDPLDFI